MIVCRRPWTLFDVDIGGAAAVAAILATTVWLVLGPWQQTWADYGRLSRQRTEMRVGLQQDLARVERYERGVQELSETAADQLAHAPTVDGYPQLLRQMTELAAESQLQLLSVAPQPPVPSGPYLVSDVQVGGRGRSRDFILFLDRLAQANPYQVLRACSLSRPPGATEPQCDLNFTVRVYLLATPELTRAGGGS